MTTFIQKSAIFILSAIVLAGCAPKSNVSTITVPTAAIETFEPVALQVFLPGSPQGDSVARQLRIHLYTKLRNQNRFSAVKPAGSEARYDMDVRILTIDTVSTGERYFLGILAGGDKIAAAVTLTDRVTGKIVSKFEVFSEASAFENTVGYGFGAAIEELVDQIIAGL